MKLNGKIVKEGSLWRAECRAIGAFTQGKSRTDALEMLADCIEVKLRRDGLKITCTEQEAIDPGVAYDVLVDSNQPETLIAELLKYQRAIHKLTAVEVAKRLGSTNQNAYSVYEQGKRTPSAVKLGEMLEAIAPELALMIGERKPAKAAAPTKGKKAAR